MRRVILLLAFTVGLAYAQGKMTPEQRQAIVDYQLTLPRANSLITSLDAMTKYVVSLPDYADRLRKAAEMSAAQRPTAAPLRLALRPSGADVLAVRLLKRRGPPLEAPLQIELPPVLSAAARSRVRGAVPQSLPDLQAATFINLAA